MTSILKKTLSPIAVVLLLILTAFAVWQTDSPGRITLLALKSHPPRVMGTTCSLVVVVEKGREDRGQRALKAAENALRRVEALMSSYLEKSEISRLNHAGEGEKVFLAGETLAVLQASKKLHKQSQGAFDITCRPLILYWQKAGKEKRPPLRSELASKRAQSRWEQLLLHTDGASRLEKTTQVDLGGIAKGYGIDQAVDALKAFRCRGGMVDVGGDIRCFGHKPGEKKWRLQVRAPSGRGTCATLELGEGAVCTSGNYFRFVEIEGKRYSHIIDPRTGNPAQAIPSVTVLGAEAMLTDGWATALSVLGPKGLKLLPSGMEAMLIVGSPGNFRAEMTPGFKPYLLNGPNL